MRVLFVYPKHAETSWSFVHALQFIDKKASYSSLGLLTIASMLPKDWEKKLIDMNVEPLEDGYLEWADYVLISAADFQQESAVEIIGRCNKLGVKVVAGGPFFTHAYPNHNDFENVSHLVLGEAEETLPRFLEDLENGIPKHAYVSDEWPDIEKSPPPMWELAKMGEYSHMAIQYSRGCPFNCEFCQITKFFGRKVRTKSKEQIITELENLYNLGWGGPIFFVDDNFIGNKHRVKTEILPAIIEWMEKRDYPFELFTQASINLADDEELMRMMVRAGFDSVFVGIESIDDDCLAEAGKLHNRNRDLVANVKRMQRLGLEVWGGFIVGFDNDKESVFDEMIQFIQESGITLAMVGVLHAAKETQLYDRLKKENRLISIDTKGSATFALNFIPKMNRKKLLEGHKKILRHIYSPKQYYSRLLTFLEEYKQPEIGMKSDQPHQLDLKKVKGLLKTMFVLGILDKGRFYYWRLFFQSLFKRPRLFIRIMANWVYGYHFRKVYGI